MKGVPEQGVCVWACTFLSGLGCALVWCAFPDQTEVGGFGHGGSCEI